MMCRYVTGLLTLTLVLVMTGCGGIESGKMIPDDLTVQCRSEGSCSVEVMGKRPTIWNGVPLKPGILEDAVIESLKEAKCFKDVAAAGKASLDYKLVISIHGFLGNWSPEMQSRWVLLRTKDDTVVWADTLREEADGMGTAAINTSCKATIRAAMNGFAVPKVLSASR